MKGLSSALSRAAVKTDASSAVSLSVIIWKSVSYDCIIDEIAKKSTDVVPLCQLVHSGSVISWTTIYNITHSRVFVYYLCDSLIIVTLVLMFCYFFLVTSSYVLDISSILTIFCCVVIRICLNVVRFTHFSR